MRIFDITLRPSTPDGIVHVYPIGDLHLDKLAFDRERAARWIDMIARDPLALAWFVGDAIDGRIPGRKHFDVEALRPDFRENLRRYTNYAAEQTVELLKPITRRGVPLVITNGNHDLYLEEGSFPEEVWRRLGKHAYYIGDEGMVRVHSGLAKGRYTTTIYGHHGTGGGKRPGPKVNAMQQTLEWIEADIVIAGHVHDGDVRIIPSVSLPSKGKLRIEERHRVMMRAPGFVRRFREGHTDYSARHHYPTSDEGLIYVRYNPRIRRAQRREAEF